VGPNATSKVAFVVTGAGGRQASCY
jgi:hypothetical protein